MTDRELVADLLPAVNLLVRVTLDPVPDQDGRAGPGDLPSRVEEVRPALRSGVPALVFIAVPQYDGDVEPPAAGTPVLVTWLTPAGLFELPTAFAGRELVGPALRAWRLQVTGPAVRAQRRRFVRVSWLLPIRVQVPGRTLSGQVLDLSEGGVRCLLPGAELTPGSTVCALLDLAGQELDFDARVVRVRLVPGPDGFAVQAALGFLDPDRHGDLVRRLIFGEQLRVRRAGLA